MLNNDTTTIHPPDVTIPVKKKRGRKPGSTKSAIAAASAAATAATAATLTATAMTVSKTTRTKTVRTTKPKTAAKSAKITKITKNIKSVTNKNDVHSNDRDIDTVMAAKMLDQLRNSNTTTVNSNSTTLLDKFASHPIISNSINYIFEKTLSTSANYLQEDSSNSTSKENDSIDPLTTSSTNNLNNITPTNELKFQNLNSNSNSHLNSSSSTSPPLPLLNNTPSKNSTTIEPSTLSSSISSTSFSLSTPSSSVSPSSNQIDLRSISPVQSQSQTQLPPLRNVLSDLPLTQDTKILNSDNFTTTTNSRSTSISPTLPNIEIRKRSIEDPIASRNKLIGLNNQDNQQLQQQQQTSFDQIQLQQQLTTKLNYLSYLKKPNNNSNLLRHQANLSSYASTQRTLQDLKDLNMINFSIESRKKLTMLINFLKLGNRQLSDRIENLIHSVENERSKNLKTVKNSDSSDSDKDESNDHPSSSSSSSSFLNKIKENQSASNSSTQELKDDIIITVKKIVNVVSKVSANSLPEPARSRVREALLKLPSNWAFAIKESNDIISHNVPRTENSGNENDDTIDSDSDLDSDDDNSDNTDDSEDSDSDENSDNDKFEDSKEYLSCPPSPKQKRTPNPNNNQFVDTGSPLITTTTITTSNTANNTSYPSALPSIKQTDNNNSKNNNINSNIRKRKSISEQLLSNLIKYSSMSKKRREEKKKRKLELSRIDTIVVQSNSNSPSANISINNSGCGIVKKKHKKRNWLRHTIKKQLLYDPNGKILIVAQESLDMINKVIKFCNDSLDKAETWNLHKQNQQTHQLVNKLETINKYLIPNEGTGNSNSTNAPNLNSSHSNLNTTTTTTTTILNNNNSLTNSQTLNKDSNLNTDKE
ncbi:hypothetical protein BVG19_g2971 [[Candida] boidinii]|nr:hypothetical protein BVG19_g2971 [[Candida] boidinii]OWB50434.1 hypothetical protein B5S27_g1984 [[Candida] boidinii]